MIAGNIIDGPPGAWPGGDVVSTDAEARAAVRKAREEHADFAKDYSYLSPEAYASVADEARRLRLRFGWEDEVRYYRPPMTPEELALWQAYFQAQLRLVKAMDEAGVGIVAGTDSGGPSSRAAPPASGFRLCGVNRPSAIGDSFGSAWFSTSIPVIGRGRPKPWSSHVDTIEARMPETSADAVQRTARIAGIWFILTFVFSIPAVLLYDPVLNDANYIVGAGSDTRVQIGALLEILTAVANIATSVVLFPVLKRQSESVALGYVGTRILESTVIVMGVISVLAIVALRQDLAGGGGANATLIGRSLVAFKDQTFLLGPAFCAGFGNGLLLGYLMYRSGLVPPRMALIGLIGGPIACATATAVLFGAYDQQSPVNFLFTAPEIVWELSLGIWLVTKGFRPAPLITGTPPKTAQNPDAA